MKLQRQATRVVEGKEYVKWVITIPPKQIEAIGWKEGDELESRLGRGSLIIKKASLEKKGSGKMTYEHFKNTILNLLRTERQGLSWMEIKKRLNLPQKVPNNLWVRMLERDIGLVRSLNPKTGKIIWKVENNV
jgi:bifunctional DNA-binding transcriptional regulator/antitoxin component of YhaV-PrlF toxin-antitoxin module